MSQRLAHWQIKDFEPGTGAAAAWSGEGWAEATAPGDTHAALIEAGRLAHPFVGRNEAAAQWVGKREWVWRTRFDTAPARAGERVELVFDGIDTFDGVIRRMQKAKQPRQGRSALASARADMEILG